MMYKITACRGVNVTEWITLAVQIESVDVAINTAKNIFLTDDWSNVAVEPENGLEPGYGPILWDAGHDEISNFSWD